MSRFCCIAGTFEMQKWMKNHTETVYLEIFHAEFKV